jgi:hypothetical protein
MQPISVATAKAASEETAENALVPSLATLADRIQGRISVPERRHGLYRCRYRWIEGMQRWIGLGVIADNFIQIGRCLSLQRA